jgi:hypothetical protein
MVGREGDGLVVYGKVACEHARRDFAAVGAVAHKGEQVAGFLGWLG